MEVAITNVAQSRHTRLRYKGFRGDRRPPLSVYIQLWPLCSIQLIICLGSPSPNLFTQLFTQGTRPVFHAGKSLKATHVSSHLEELLSDGRKNHQRKDASKVMHLQSTKCFEQNSWMSRFIFCETRFLLWRKKIICEREKVTFLLLLVPALLLLEARAVLLGASLKWNWVVGLFLTTGYLVTDYSNRVFCDWLCESGPGCAPGFEPRMQSIPVTVVSDMVKGDTTEWNSPANVAPPPSCWPSSPSPSPPAADSCWKTPSVKWETQN